MRTLVELSFTAHNDTTTLGTPAAMNDRDSPITPSPLITPTTLTLTGNLFKDSLRDVNGDGILDVVTSNLDPVQGNQFLIRYGTGTTTFGATQIYSTNGNTATPIAWGDIDGNGRLDLLLQTPSAFSSLQQQTDQSFVVQSNAGSPAVNPSTVSFGSNPIKTIVGEVNGDWVPDLIGLTSTGLSVQVGYGDGTYANPLLVSLPGANQAIAPGDLNGDGKLDVATVTTDSNSSKIYVQLGGATTFSEKRRYQFNGSVNTGTIALADLDLDGAIDIVTVEQDSSGNGRAVLRLNDRLRLALPSGTGKKVTEYDTYFDPVTGLFTGTYTQKFNQVTRTIDELGRQTIYQLDGNTGNVIRSIRVMGTIDSATQLAGHTGDDVVTDYTYAVDGRVLEMRDALNHVTRYDYTVDAKNVGGNLRRMYTAYGTVDQAMMEYEYDAAGNQTASIDEYGNRTTYTTPVKVSICTTLR
jgi:FG-GAP-like repeat